MKVLLRPIYGFATLPKWATIDPYTLSAAKPHTVSNILDGKTIIYKKTIPIVDPLNGGNFLNVSVP
jgi:hypothetical protein